jgi:hypothetical protein
MGFLINFGVITFYTSLCTSLCTPNPEMLSLVANLLWWNHKVVWLEEYIEYATGTHTGRQLLFHD